MTDINLSDQLSANEKSVSFLEGLVLQLEQHFLSLNVENKLHKRKTELTELKSIVEDFSEKLADMREHLLSDIAKIQERSVQQRKIQSLTGNLLDEEGKPVDLLSELTQV